jgi:glutathione S-transferase
MTYHLILGDRAYSSWSLRGWLLFEAFGIDRTQEMISFIDDRTVGEMLADHAPARTVPTMITPDGAIVSESLSIAEELASRHPGAGIWPEDARARATARTLASEMHAGFGALREDCPMNLRVSYADFAPSDAVMADLRRLETIWDHARETCRPDGAWLCGAYSAADAFFAPVAARIAGYGLKVSDSAQAYVDAHLAHLPFRRWRAMGLVRGADLPWYAKDFAQRPWPGPQALTARAVTEGQSENTACPYSGKPVTDLAEIDGRIFGFCNTFCRDKTVADPEAWPAFMDMKQS